LTLKDIQALLADDEAVVIVDLGQLPVSASQECIEPKQEATAASYQADLERERERAERLAELLRAKADTLAAPPRLKSCTAQVLT
jgi:hypothetical protein